MATGYVNTFITIAPDCPVREGLRPGNAASVAGLQHDLLSAQPYALTGEELIFAVHLRHKGIGEDADLAAVRAALISKPHPCLRASMLPKRFGWGVHYDEAGRIAIYGAETDAYCRFVGRNDVKVIPAMRNRRQQMADTA